MVPGTGSRERIVWSREQGAYSMEQGAGGRESGEVDIINCFPFQLIKE